MSLEVVSIILGPAVTNAYLIADGSSGEAAVIDPAWDGYLILEAAQKRGWRIANIWFTHAHFDHLGGAAAVADGSNPPPPVALHPDDYWLWRTQGGAAAFGLSIDPGPEPTIDFSHEQILHLGEYELEVRYAPGHTP
ncbi:MAG: MBL fold metallo-hydrolase, partial [Chloroflexi bacterium]|nr:MBL fold metallo-hydrolase [Chloroflexota bacterium]